MPLTDTIKTFLFCFLGFLTPLFADADVRLPGFFGDNMVLQRNQPIPVWGRADAGESINIRFNKQRVDVKADGDGKWMIKLNAEKAGGTFQLTVKGKNTITLKNILVGEVWICSGQSNMEFTVHSSINADKEMTGAMFPQIRHIKIPHAVSPTPLNDIKSAEWKVCSPQTVGDFTAIGYFFARELFNDLKVPVGLINTSWGGTHVETWTSRKAFENDVEFKDMIATMPHINLDSLTEVRKKAARQKLEELQGPSRSYSNPSIWKEFDINDSKWPVMQLPGLWEKQLGDVDGIVWFRKTLTLPATDSGKAATLELGMIDDSDETYVNGRKVGSLKGKYNEKRKYAIPAGLLKTGKNIIAVRVEDTGGGGGVYGDSSDMRLSVGNGVTPLSGVWQFRVESVSAENASIGPNSYPTLLFNAMVNPLIPFAFKGVLWYQGESNAGRAYQYRKAFPLMITDWRKQWNQGNFPFLFVQLASFNASNGNSRKGSTWAELREAQTMTLSLPNTGMAVTTDVGEARDIHPRNKQDVGRRLAAIALHDVYGKNVAYSGPVYKSMSTEGNKITLSFTHSNGGLVTKEEGAALDGFEIAGSDQIFYPANAEITGDRIVVSADSVSNPVAVRYAWRDNAEEANLFNKEGFPAMPFRTDKWKGITEEEKFSISR